MLLIFYHACSSLGTYNISMLFNCVLLLLLLLLQAKIIKREQVKINKNDVHKEQYIAIIIFEYNTFSNY